MWIDWLHDFRLGLRQILQRPTFALVAVASLAIGIGANTVLFGALNTLLLHTIFSNDTIANALFAVLPLHLDTLFARLKTLIGDALVLEGNHFHLTSFGFLNAHDSYACTVSNLGIKGWHNTVIFVPKDIGLPQKFLYCHGGG